MSATWFVPAPCSMHFGGFPASCPTTRQTISIGWRCRACRTARMPTFPFPSSTTRRAAILRPVVRPCRAFRAGFKLGVCGVRRGCPLERGYVFSLLRPCRLSDIRSRCHGCRYTTHAHRFSGHCSWGMDCYGFCKVTLLLFWKWL